MIHGYSDHAANERTFLAWVRTGIAVIAFGLVIEKFSLFLATIAMTGGVPAEKMPFGRYDGLALILSGAATLALATIRFVRTTKRLDGPETYSAKDVRAELILSTALVLLVAVYTICVALD